MSLFNPQWIQDLENFIAKAESDKAKVLQILSGIQTAVSDVKSLISAIEAEIQALKNNPK